MIREQWAASFGPDKELWLLTEKGDVAEFLTRDKPNGDPHGCIPGFHVWKGDRWLYSGSSQEAADRAFARALEEK